MKKGISLVALVITIIVLIILSAAVILSFREGGIIDRADQAVEGSNDAVLEEKITNMNLEYTQKMKKRFTLETRELLKAIVKQSGIDLDKLMVYYDLTDGEQHVFYKIDKVTKKDVEWFLDNPIEVDGETKKIHQLFGDVDLDGEITEKDYDLYVKYTQSTPTPELPLEEFEYCDVVGDINGYGIDPGDEFTIRCVLDGAYKITDIYTEEILSIKEEQLKIYFGIE